MSVPHCVVLGSDNSQGAAAGSQPRQVINLRSDIWDQGQAYVALSRVHALPGVLVGLTTASFDKNKCCVYNEYARLADYPRV